MDVVKHTPWLVPLVLFGMVGSVVLLRPTKPVSGAATQASDKASRAKRPEPNAKQSDGSAAAENEQPNARIYSPDCKKPKDHPEADLCAQRRMAEAAEWQNWINSWGLAGLVATVVATGLAAIAAWRTVWTMQDTAERQLRAYVFPSVVKLMGFTIGESPRASIEIKNTGQTPAYDVMATAALLIAHRTIEREFPEIPAPLAISKSTLGAGQVKRMEHGEGPKLSAPEHAAVLAGITALYLVGTIRYADAFKKPRTTRFRLIYDQDCATRNDGAMSVCVDGNVAD